MGTNSAGFTSKKESFFNLVNSLNSCIITIEETNNTKIKNLNLPGYQNFERLRNGKSGGGILTCIIEDLGPVLIHVGNDDIELMTVEVKVGTEQIRVINGYCLQESEDSIAIINYWQEFKSEVFKSK